jgi:hypothetical protein
MDINKQHVERLLKLILTKSRHGIPYYAYGDNEAAVDMSDRLDTIDDAVCQLAQHLEKCNIL